MKSLVTLLLTFISDKTLVSIEGERAREKDERTTAVRVSKFSTEGLSVTCENCFLPLIFVMN